MNTDVAQAYPFILQGETQHKPLVGISACLCGDNVRYDGREKGQPDLIESLQKQLNLFKVCPEVAIGMSVPRPPIQLSRKQGKIEARGVDNPQQNVTAPLQNYARSLVKKYSENSGNNSVLCGFVLKSRSPSCGSGSTPIHENDLQVDVGSGIFSQQLQQQMPWLPIAEEDALITAGQRLDFIFQSQLVQLFWQHCLGEPEGLTGFHKQIRNILDNLPSTANSELETLLSDSPGTHYLTRLIKALQTKQ